MSKHAISTRVLPLLAIVVLLILFSGFFVFGGTRAFTRYQQAQLENQQHCSGQSPVHICVQSPTALFSAFYRSYTATHSPLFTVRYSSDAPITLVVKVQIINFSRESSRTVTAQSSVQSISFAPDVDRQELLNTTSEENTALHVQVTDTRGHQYYVNDIPLLLHSRYLMQWVQANRLRIGAWVTPDDTAIAGVVRKAIARLPEQAAPAPEGMIGYVSASPQQVIDQVDALYDTLRLDYQLKYVQATVPYSGTDSPHADVTQSIKLPSEVLQQRSGMCVELTTLLASAVEHIGLNAEIIIIPGHAFLGVATSPDNQHFEYWDPVDMNNNVAADSANVAANHTYAQQQQLHAIVDTILLSDARDARIGPMV